VTPEERHQRAVDRFDRQVEILLLIMLVMVLILLFLAGFGMAAAIVAAVMSS
jgi:hypothetical protein